jgi:16S rRNA (cytidine1402-2'-O)-methyltransferase
MVEKSGIIKPGTLYIVATPIGNIGDITMRAVEILKGVDAVICEELRSGSTLLKKLGIENKPIVILNEHTERQIADNLVIRLHMGENLALVSDCGTPVFSDPGHFLIHQAVSTGVAVKPIPGVSSITAALSILDFEPKQFLFAGFLPRQPEERNRELKKLQAQKIAIVLMDTPYRMSTILQEVGKVFGQGQQVTLACNLTLPDETIYRGTIGAIHKQTVNRKAEFLLIIHPPSVKL